MPFGCNVRNSRIQKHKVLTHGQERLFHKVTSVSIHSFVEWLDTFSYVLRPADMTVKEVNHIRCFAIDIAKDLILLSCCLAMEHLCVLQLETALATLVTTWFTLADRQWRSRYRSSDQCILHGLHWLTVDEGLDILKDTLVRAAVSRP
jgi:hypothetical protein